MTVSYNLSLLFDESEFDVLKSCTRYGSKEAFFEILHRFTLDIDRLFEKFQILTSDDAAKHINELERWTDRLKGLLTSIGAINLAWKVQSAKQALSARNVTDFLEKTGEILSELKGLRDRIDKARKTDNAFAQAGAQSGEDSEEKALEEQNRNIIAHRAVFEKLFMLIENFELDSAAKTAISVMREHYSPGIDQALAVIYKALGEFDYAKAILEARNLLSSVNNIKENEKHELKRILAIDDFPGVLMTVDAMLKGKYKVCCMTDYSSAAKFLTSNTVDLFLLDIEMPGIDGFAMIQLFRSIPEYAETPIIFLTSHGTDEHIKTAMRLGARDFIRKPVDLAVLLKKLESAFSE